VASVVCVHGIGQQGLGERSLLTTWEAALVDGVTRHVDATRSAAAGNMVSAAEAVC